MMISIWWLILPFWVALGIFLVHKQKRAILEDAVPEVVVAFFIVFSPFVFLLSIIRQVFIEDWK